MDNPIMAIVPCGFYSVFFGFYFIIMFLSVAVGLVTTVAWIIFLIDVIQRDKDAFPNKDENQRLIWILVLIFGSWIGAVLYYVLVYRIGKDPKKLL